MDTFLIYKEKVNKFIPRNDFDNQEREYLLNLLINFNYTLIDEYITEWKLEKLNELKNRIIGRLDNKIHSSSTFFKAMKSNKITTKILNIKEINDETEKYINELSLYI